MTAAEVVNRGRQYPLSEERATAYFEWMDSISRTLCRGPAIGPVDTRRPLERLASRVRHSGQPVRAIEELRP